jgi:hypothetical protein
MKNAALCAVAFTLAAGTAVSPTRAGSGIPEAVERAASFNSNSLSGVIVEQRHIDLKASAGPMHYAEQNDAIVLLEDGELKHVRYLRITQNGNTVSDDQVAQRETQNNDDLDHGKMFFKQPYDAHYIHDYAYNVMDCASCGSREQHIAFHSEVRDDQHGDGTMIVDPSTGHVMSVTYSPNVMPQRASSGTTVETFGEAAPGVWTIVSIDRTFGGHVAFFKGSCTMTERMDHFQRFGNSVAAMQYLQRASVER